jgi:hypothetical protein
MCGNPITITANKKSYKYAWSTGETSDQIKIEKPGMYWVKAITKVVLILIHLK